MEKFQFRQLKNIPQQIANFFDKCADNYHENKLSRWATRVGLLSSAFLEIIGGLNNNPEQVAAYGILGLLFGTPVLINLIREKIKYYESIEYEKNRIERKKQELRNFLTT